MSSPGLLRIRPWLAPRPPALDFSSMLGTSGRAAALVAALALAAGCASTQKVSLECVPSEVSVYVDGRELEDRRGQISLGVDEAHTVFFKGGGYQTQMVVLESQEVDGVYRLSNADLCREVVFTEMRPELRIEVEQEP